MKYYVSVGRGGALFHIGLLVNGMLGSAVYWWASRSRGASIAKLSATASDRAPVEGRPPQPYDQPAAGSLVGSSARDDWAPTGTGRERHPLDRLISQ